MTIEESIAVLGYDMQPKSIEEVQRLTDHATQAVASLYKHHISLVDETMFKTNREVKRYFGYMSKDDEEYHQSLAKKYIDLCNVVVKRYTDVIKHILLYPNLYAEDFSLASEFNIPYKGTTYCSGPAHRFELLCEQCKEVLKRVTTAYFGAIYKWIRGY